MGSVLYFLSRIWELALRGLRGWECVLVRFFFVVSFFPPSSAVAYTYRAKAGDTLSEVLYQHLGPPIYGAKGCLRYTALKNKMSNVNTIFPGQEIEIPSLEEWSQQNGERKVASGEEKKMEEKQPEIANISAPPNPPAPAFLPHSEIEVLPSFSFLQVEGLERSNSSRAVLISRLVSGADFSWSQLWSERVKTYALLGAKKITIESASSRTLLNGSQTYSKIEFGSKLRLLDHVEVGVGVGAEEQVLYRAVSATEVQIDAVPMPVARGSLAYEFARARPLSAGVQVGASYYFPVNTVIYNTGHGASYDGKLFLTHETPAVRLRTGFYYGINKQETSLLDFTRTDMGVELGMSWRIGP